MLVPSTPPPIMLLCKWSIMFIFHMMIALVLSVLCPKCKTSKCLLFKSLQRKFAEAPQIIRTRTRPGGVRCSDYYLYPGRGTQHSGQHGRGTSAGSGGTPPSNYHSLFRFAQRETGVVVHTFLQPYISLFS